MRRQSVRACWVLRNNVARSKLGGKKTNPTWMDFFATKPVTFLCIAGVGVYFTFRSTMTIYNGYHSQFWPHTEAEITHFEKERLTWSFPDGLYGGAIDHHIDFKYTIDGLPLSGMPSTFLLDNSNFPKGSLKYDPNFATRFSGACPNCEVRSKQYKALFTPGTLFWLYYHPNPIYIPYLIGRPSIATLKKDLEKGKLRRTTAYPLYSIDPGYIDLIAYDCMLFGPGILGSLLITSSRYFRFVTLSSFHNTY